MIEIRDVSKWFGDSAALDYLNLSVARGELFGLVGSDGAGKTTLFRILSGILLPDSGQVTIDGIDATADNRKLREKIGYVPDVFGVYENMTVGEYMRFFASLYGVGEEKAGKLCEELLEMVQLSDQAEVMADALPHGVKQRLALARSLIHNPEVLILDETVSSLDTRARHQMQNILKELQERGKTILISAHILSELSPFCTAFGMVEQGRMIIQGTLEEITQKASMGNPLVIRVAGQREKAVEFLKQKDGVSTILLDEQDIIVGFDGGQEEQAVLLRELVGQGVMVASFQRRTGDLEYAFMRVAKNHSDRARGEFPDGQERRGRSEI